MGRIIKAVLALALAAFIALVAYAYLWLPVPDQVPVTKPVALDGG